MMSRIIKDCWNYTVKQNLLSKVREGISLVCCKNEKILRNGA
jgi:hypothetical protein